MGIKGKISQCCLLQKSELMRSILKSLPSKMGGTSKRSNVQFSTACLLQSFPIRKLVEETKFNFPLMP
jgi:hypothetical protein